jgi:hypothetical protein
MLRSIFKSGFEPPTNRFSTYYSNQAELLKFFIPAARSRTTTLLRLHPGYKSVNIKLLNKILFKNYQRLLKKFYLIKCFKPNLLPARDGRCVQDLSTYSP